MKPLSDRLAEGFERHFGGAPERIVRAPGRVNLIGEHTDYNEGFALPIAIGAETRIAFRPRPGRHARVAALDFDDLDAFEVDGVRRGPARGWTDYVRGVAALLGEAGVEVPGCELAIAGDIPKGTGLSSSASLEVAVAMAFLHMAGEQWDPKRVALLAQSAECEFAGVRCGNLDQLASAATTAGAALMIDCRSLDLRPVPLPDDAVVMIVQSGVARGLLEGEYNARRAECEEAAAMLGVPSLRHVTAAALDDLARRARPTVVARARHIITENDRVLATFAALSSGDLGTAGRLMVEAHGSQRDDFGITVAETDRLADIMNAAIGGLGGARQTGGGFGGAVVGLMPAHVAENVRRKVLDGYATPGGDPPDVRLETARAGAGFV